MAKILKFDEEERKKLEKADKMRDLKMNRTYIRA